MRRRGGFIGAGLAFEQLTFAALFAALFLATHLPAIYGEERLSRERLGSQFEAYVRAVPRLVPRSWGFSVQPSAASTPRPIPARHSTPA